MKFRKLTEEDLREENLPLECWFGTSKRIIKKDMVAYDTIGSYMTNNVVTMLEEYQVEVKEQDFTGLTKCEALKAMIDGHEVRDENFHKTARLYWDTDSLTVKKRGSSGDVHVVGGIFMQDTHATYSIYEEEPKTEIVEFFQIIGDEDFYSDCGLFLSCEKYLNTTEDELEDNDFPFSWDREIKTGLSVQVEIDRENLKVIKEVK